MDSTDYDKLIDSALSKYYRTRLVHDTGSWMLDQAYESSDEKLRRDEQRLSIAVKRRQLGLPDSSEDYETAINDGLSFTEKGAVAAFAKHGLSRLPAPDFLKAPQPRGLMEAISPKITSFAGKVGDYFGLRGSIPHVGGRLGTAARIFAKF